MNLQRKILVVDDDFAVRLLLERIIQKGGYEVFVATNGKTAQDLVQQNPIDLVIVDLNMPVFDGLRFLRWIREDLKLAIPVIIFTAQKVEGIEERSKAAGASAVLFKPKSPLQILQKIKELLTT